MLLLPKDTNLFKTLKYMTKSDNKFSSFDFVQKTKSPLTFLIRLCLYSLIILVGLNSCTPSIKEQLKQAEELLSTDPDSSYNILNKIENPKKQSESEYATWFFRNITNKADLLRLIIHKAVLKRNWDIMTRHRNHS